MATEAEEKEAKRKETQEKNYPPVRLPRFNWDPADLVLGEPEKKDYREEE
jgi:hypothetical protein